MEQMTSLPPSAELKALLEAIDQQDFKALSTGLGLGALRPAVVAKPRQPPSQSRPAAGAGPDSPLPWSSLASAASRGEPLAASAQQTPVRPKQAGIGRLILAWSLDLLFVALTLTGALALAFAAHAWRGDSAAWLAGKPVQWLLGLNPLISLAAVYALFLVYALFFRVLVGRTCGETLLGLRPRTLRRSLKGRA